MKRIFVAIDLSLAARTQTENYIAELKNEFRNVRVGWEKPAKLHLTLKFLGDTAEQQLEKLKLFVREISSQTAKFNLTISQTGVFPNAENPRVLWIDVLDEQGNLAKINQFLENQCEKIGFKREKRKFVPHLTIGRLREPHKALRLAAKHLENKFEPLEFEVSGIVIYESQLQPGGSVFSVVSRNAFFS